MREAWPGSAPPTRCECRFSATGGAGRQHEVALVSPPPPPTLAQTLMTMHAAQVHGHGHHAVRAVGRGGAAAAGACVCVCAWGFASVWTPAKQVHLFRHLGTGEPRSRCLHALGRLGGAGAHLPGSRSGCVATAPCLSPPGGSLFARARVSIHLSSRARGCWERPGVALGARKDKEGLRGPSWLCRRRQRC